MRKVLITSLLILTLSFPAHAGILLSDYAPPPPPPTEEEPTSAPDETGGEITEAIASLLSGLLTVL